MVLDDLNSQSSPMWYIFYLSHRVYPTNVTAFNNML